MSAPSSSPFFPQWIHEPRWLIQRQIRQRQQAERRRKRLEEARARRRERRRKALQKRREREKRAREREARGEGNAADEERPTDDSVAAGKESRRPPHYNNDEGEVQKTEPANREKGANSKEAKRPSGAKTPQDRHKGESGAKERPKGQSQRGGQNSSRKSDPKSKTGTNKTDAEKAEERARARKPTQKKVSVSEPREVRDNIGLTTNDSELRQDAGNNSEVTETEDDAEQRKKAQEEMKRRRKRRLGRRLQGEESFDLYRLEVRQALFIICGIDRDRVIRSIKLYIAGLW